MMNGKQGRRTENEAPIGKPSSPLPLDFDRGIFSESPTLRKSDERAYFYKKKVSGSGSATYGFYISNSAIGLRTETV